MVVFVLVGIAAGILAARVMSGGAPPSADALPNSEPRASTRPAGGLPSRPPRVLQRDLSPSDVRYDPAALLKEAQGTLSSKEVFEAEPRDPAFAPVLEQRARAALDLIVEEMGIAENVREVHTECKTLSCYTYIEVAKSDAAQVYDRVNGIMLGDVQSPGLVDGKDEGLSYVTIYNLYRPETRDESYYKKFLEEAMRPALEFHKDRYLQQLKAPNEAPH